MPASRPAPAALRPDPLAPSEEVFYAPPSRGVDLLELLDLLMRGKWTVLACVLAVLVPAALWALSQPSRYASYAVVLVEKRDSGLPALTTQPGSYFAPERNLENELLVLRESLPLAEAAAAAILRYPTLPGTDRVPTLTAPSGGRAPSVRDVALRLHAGYVSSVQEGPNVDAVRISGISTDPVEAALVANVYADAFATLTRTQSRSGVSASRSFLEGQVADKGNELAELDEAVRQFMNREGAVALDQETSQLVTQIAALEADRDAADVEIELQRATIAALQGELAEILPSLARRPASAAGLPRGCGPTNHADLVARFASRPKPTCSAAAQMPRLQTAPESV